MAKNAKQTNKTLDANTLIQRISYQKTVQIIREYQKDGECVGKV
jgi:hypothetical protein